MSCFWKQIIYFPRRKLKTFGREPSTVLSIKCSVVTSANYIHGTQWCMKASDEGSAKFNIGIVYILDFGFSFSHWGYDKQCIGSSINILYCLDMFLFFSPYYWVN
jgi:hypothetical protein